MAYLPIPSKYGAGQKGRGGNEWERREEEEREGTRREAWGRDEPPDFSTRIRLWTCGQHGGSANGGSGRWKRPALSRRSPCRRTEIHRHRRRRIIEANQSCKGRCRCCCCWRCMVVLTSARRSAQRKNRRRHHAFGWHVLSLSTRKLRGLNYTAC